MDTQAIIETLARLDWIERADELLRALAGVRSHRFTIDRQGGWSGQQVEDLLKSRGVKIWGRSFDSERLFFRVDARQANWAEYTMHRYGVPVISKPFNRQNQNAQRAAYPGKQRMPKVGPVERVVDIILGAPRQPYPVPENQRTPRAGLVDRLLSFLASLLP